MTTKVVNRWRPTNRYSPKAAIAVLPRDALATVNKDQEEVRWVISATPELN